MAKYFLQRPVFASVISIFIVILGLFCLTKLPVEQFPSMTPVQVSVTTYFPGASAETLAECIAAPLEQAINGVEDMIYMYSQNAGPGVMNLTVCFKIGVDPNLALINTQTKVNATLASLPIEVQNQGVVVKRQQPNILLFVALQAKKGLVDDIFLSNYANTNVAFELARVEGVSVAQVLNARDYSMRIWIKPDRLAQFGLTTGDVITAIQEQSDARSIGMIGQEPVEKPNQLTIPVNGLGRLKTQKEFESIILRANRDASMVLLKDVSRVEIGAQSYDLLATLNGTPGAFIGIYQDSEANAIGVSNRIKAKMAELSQFFPEGITYSIPYDTSTYINESIWHVEKTLIEAALLVGLVIFVFLHSLRASLVPFVAMVVSITGTFIGMYLLGFSLNTLSLFGLVLSVGIVVDDAIVVVENIERNMRLSGLSAHESAIKTMKEVSKPIIAIVCVLASVFIPVSFIGGIPGQFYRQFAITIACSVFISGFVALTLSPVLSVLLLKKETQLHRFGAWFNQSFDALTEKYIKGTRWLLERPKKGALFCLSILGCIAFLAMHTPVSLVPHEDQGLLIISADLPDGASLARVQEVSSKIEKICMETPGVDQILSVSGYSLIESIPRINKGAYYVELKPWNQRKSKNLHAFQIIDHLNQRLSQIPEAKISAFNPPDIPGIGVIGGIDFWIQNQGDASYSELNSVVDKIVAKGKQKPEFKTFITSIRSNCMELFLDVDVAKAKSLGVNLQQIYGALQTLLGSVYVNQFNKFGKVFHVVAQADPHYRNTIADIGSMFVRSDSNQMIPLKSLVVPRFAEAPALVQRFNGSPAALISVIPRSGSTGKLISEMENLSKEFLLPRMNYSWGGLAFQEKQTGGVSNLAIVGSLIFVFLVLSALYERWTLSIAILLSFPFAVFGAFLAVWLTSSIANIYFQIGIVTLIGLSAKNAILIVEFAKEKRKEGLEISEAALAGARLRFRAVIMTSLTTIIGALPLVITSGAGAASRHSVGIGVIGGMFMATFLAIFFVPLFYAALENLSERFKNKGE